MSRQAKIQISADVQQLKQAVEQAKKTMQGLGAVKISNKSLDAIKQTFGTDLEKRINGASKHIENLEKKIAALGAAGTSPLDKQFSKALEKVKLLKTELKELKDIKGKLDSGSFEVGDVKKSGGMMKAVTGGVGKVAGMLGIGYGLSALYSSGVETAKQRNSLRSLTGGSIVNPNSEMGFSPEERRTRATEIAKSLGRNVSEGELERLTTLGEKLERSYGIEGQVTSGAMKEGRRAGIQDQQKFLAQSIGVAVTNGLEGSRIGEHLSAMTDFMSELADGITINTDTVNAISAAFGDIPFFKNDPSRLFNQMRGMDAAFKGGDRFQQAQAARAIQASIGGKGASPAAIELRRQLGLFGGSANLQNETGIEALGVGGGKILDNMFKEMKGSTKGMTKEEQMYEIMTRAGLQGEGGIRIANRVMKGKGSGITEKEIQMAQMSPEKQLEAKMQERMISTFSGVDKKTAQLDASIQALKEYLAGDFMAVLMRLVEAAEGIAKFFGITPTAKGTATAIGVGAAGYAANKLTGGALSRGATAAGSKAISAASPVLGRMAPYATKAMPWLSKSLGVAGAIMPDNLFQSAEDMGESPEQLQKMQLEHYIERGGKIGPKEAKILGRMPLGGGVISPEAQASGFTMPEMIQTNDPTTNSILAAMYQLMQSKGAGIMVDRRGPAPAMGMNTKVGK